MVAPVRGGKTVSVQEPNSILVVSGQRQSRPYNLPLPYYLERAVSSGGGNAWRYLSFARDNDMPNAYNRAYADLVDKLGDAASLGVTLGQWRQADTMIKTRAHQLVSFTKALAGRNPLGVAGSLGLSLRDVKRIMRTRYGVARNLSDLWLEFWFGWKPMVQDIYTACEVFNQPIPSARFKGRGQSSKTMTQVGGPICGEALDLFWSKKVEIGADVRLVNPNVYLLNQFGLLNPAVVAYDMVPWSFVLDWFMNVNSWLSSFTDFAGLETSNGYVTSVKKCWGNGYWTGSGCGPNPPPSHSGVGVVMSRGLVSTIPRPTLAFKELSLKPARALTAITLLVQKLPGGRYQPDRGIEW